jgi:hypothetical protein
VTRLSPRILLVLAVPAGIIGYLVGVRVIEALPLAPDLQDLLALTVPLFIAGLCMLPFLVPTFDRMAKRDLAAHRAQQEADAEAEEQDRP